jgi:glutathione S-transferase
MAPNPRRARIFLKEKGLDVPKEEINILEGENLKDDYLAVNPFGLVPALELDDGTVITEAPAICRYIESQHPEPNLMGTDPLETARIESWERFAEMSGMQAVGEMFRNMTPVLDDRGLPGMTGIDRIPALVERGKKRIANFYKQLEDRLSESEYLAGDRLRRRLRDLCRAGDPRRQHKHQAMACRRRRTPGHGRLIKSPRRYMRTVLGYV